MSKIIFNVNNPYPIPQVEEANVNYANLLLDSYAGDISEDTAIHQYLFQYIMLDDSLKELKEALMKIGEVEMYHLKLLGETVKLLGVIPVYGNISLCNNFKFWSSEDVNYSLNIKEMLLANIENEKNVIDKYKYNYRNIKDKYIRKLLLRIIEDEELHVSIFKYFYEKISLNS